MKNLLTVVALGIFTFLPMYAFGTFVNWEFNPGDWDVFSRVVIGFVWLVSFFVALTNTLIK